LRAVGDGFPPADVAVPAAPEEKTRSNMTIHLIKLAVGVTDVAHLRLLQAHRLDAFKEVFHRTRMRPKRHDELLDCGSLYWVIRGVVAARQRVLGLHDDHDEEGRPCCRIELDATLVETHRQPRKAFQGWRYLDPAAAPPDLTGPAGQGDDLPPEMVAELKRLGLM
jgi:hypothetical protein